MGMSVSCGNVVGVGNLTEWHKTIGKTKEPPVGLPFLDNPIRMVNSTSFLGNSPAFDSNLAEFWNFNSWKIALHACRGSSCFLWYIGVFRKRDTSCCWIATKILPGGGRSETYSWNCVEYTSRHYLALTWLNHRHLCLYFIVNIIISLYTCRDSGYGSFMSQYIRFYSTYICICIQWHTDNIIIGHPRVDRMN